MDRTYTLINTGNCNLRCAYCYVHDKQPIVMSNEVVDKVIEFIKEDVVLYEDCSRFIVDIIGGEPLYHLDNIKYIYESFCATSFPLPFIFNITTNGTMFTLEAKSFFDNCDCKKMFVGLSLDGIKECHDIYRSNSFDKVMQDFSWWRGRFPCSTIKATLIPDTAKYYFDNVIFFHSLGLDRIIITPAFEYEWSDEHLSIYRSQLEKTAEYLLGLPKNLKPEVWQFSNSVLRGRDAHQGWCGSGKYMKAFDVNGNIYPCHRFSTTCNKPPLVIGNVFDNTLDYNRLRPFNYACIENMNKKECLSCEANSICSMCLAYNYDETGSILKRSANNCELVKITYSVSKEYNLKLKERGN